jgi:serine/threonine protein kinase
MSICNLCKKDLTDNNLCPTPDCPNKINVFEKATIIQNAIPEDNLNEIPENQKDFESEESSNFLKSNVFNLNTNLASLDVNKSGSSNIFSQETNLGVPFVEKPNEPDRYPEIEGFEVIKLIGVGGMGMVLEANQISLDRKVAIKILPPKLATIPDFVSRFKTEATALAKLTHPNIVTIFDRGHKGNLVYFVMEFIEGNLTTGVYDLRHAVEKKKLNISQIKKYGIQIAQGLSYAHKIGIVHRDIKPSNILLDSFDNAKITDFGIAALRTSETGNEGRTVVGQAMGTMGYMAPEQAKDAKNIDGRADIYSFGVVLYECLTGSIPGGIFLPPSKSVEGLDKAWDDLIEKMLQPDKDKRIADMGQVESILESILIYKNDMPPPPISGFGADITSRTSTISAGIATTPPSNCLFCSKPIFGQTGFCSSCGKALKCKCPECDLVMTNGIQFCGGCGLHLGNLFQFDEIKKNINNLEKELYGLPLTAQYFEKMENIVLAWKRASELIASKKIIFNYKKSLEKLLLELTKVAYEAWKNNNKPECLCFLKKIRRIQPNHFPVVNLEKNMAVFIEKTIITAKEEIKKGNLLKTVKTLSDLKSQYPDEPTIETALEEAKKTETEVKSLIEITLPQFKKEKKIYALRNSLTYLKSLELPFEWVDKTLIQVKSLFSKADENILKAKDALEKNDRKNAGTIIEQILSNISDHPEALLIKSQLLLEGEASSSFQLKVKNAILKQNYFLAEKIVDDEESCGREVSRNLKAEINIGVNRSVNFHSVIKTWCFGLGILFAINFLSLLLVSGILTRLNFDFLSSESVRTNIEKSVFLFFNAVFIRFAFIPWRFVPNDNYNEIKWLGLIIASLTLNSFLFNYLSFSLIEKSSFLTPLSKFIDGGLFGISYSLIIKYHFIKIIPNPSLAEISVRSQIFLGLLVGTILTVFAPMENVVTWVFVPYFLIIGLSPILTISFSKLGYIYTFIGCLLGFFAIAGDQKDFGSYSNYLGFAWIFIIFVSVIFSTSNKIEKSTLILSLVISLSSFGLSWFLFKKSNLALFFSLWTLMLGTFIKNGMFRRVLSFPSLNPLKNQIAFNKPLLTKKNISISPWPVSVLILFVIIYSENIAFSYFMTVDKFPFAVVFALTGFVSLFAVVFGFLTINLLTHDSSFNQVKNWAKSLSGVLIVNIGLIVAMLVIKNLK